MKLARMLSLLTGALLACQSFIALAEIAANSMPDVAAKAFTPRIPHEFFRPARLRKSFGRRNPIT